MQRMIWIILFNISYLKNIVNRAATNVLQDFENTKRSLEKNCFKFETM